MLIDLETDNLAQIINEKEKVVVLFMANWCGNCKKIKPKFKKIASEIEDIDFIVVDAEKHKDSRKLATITSLPTFASYYSGDFVEQVSTSVQQVLEDFVNDIKQRKVA